jgi:hypothetical protein
MGPIGQSSSNQIHDQNKSIRIVPPESQKKSEGGLKTKTGKSISEDIEKVVVSMLDIDDRKSLARLDKHFQAVVGKMTQVESIKFFSMFINLILDGLRSKIKENPKYEIVFKDIINIHNATIKKLSESFLMPKVEEALRNAKDDIVKSFITHLSETERMVTSMPYLQHPRGEWRKGAFKSPVELFNLFDNFKERIGCEEKLLKCQTKDEAYKNIRQSAFITRCVGYHFPDLAFKAIKISHKFDFLKEHIYPYNHCLEDCFFSGNLHECREAVLIAESGPSKLEAIQHIAEHLNKVISKGDGAERIELIRAAITRLPAGKEKLASLNGMLDALLKLKCHELVKSYVSEILELLKCTDDEDISADAGVILTEIGLIEEALTLVKLLESRSKSEFGPQRLYYALAKFYLKKDEKASMKEWMQKLPEDYKKSFCLEAAQCFFERKDLSAMREILEYCIKNKIDFHPPELDRIRDMGFIEILVSYKLYYQASLSFPSDKIVRL